MCVSGYVSIVSNSVQVVRVEVGTELDLIRCMVVYVCVFRGFERRLAFVVPISSSVVVRERHRERWQVRWVFV